ncbi:uncharacterized protein DEA37_0013764 [Paragonimus westermani]|uniref:Peptidase A2 domain-containing protein n=1 Tax=Paragonimus westermani TaxID=34504 RepID=A0A5J4NQ85_9TREM|nr:uncharacterized protein DEA37_0013764 [Paragonimus westermani]
MMLFILICSLLRLLEALGSMISAKKILGFCSVIGIYLTLFYSIFAVYYTSPLVRGSVPIPLNTTPFATHLVFIITDGMRADKLFGSKMENAPFIKVLISVLGDRIHSQLLRHMRSLVGYNSVGDSILRQLCTKCLPINTSVILSVQDPDTLLEKLAETADKVYEYFFKRSINHVHDRSPHADAQQETLDNLQRQVSQLTLTVNNLAGRPMKGRKFSRTRPRSCLRPRIVKPQTSDICYYHRRFDNFIGLRFFIDTGAKVSVISPSKIKRDLKPAEYILQAANNSKIVTYGQHLLTVDLGLRRSFPWIFIMADVQHPLIDVLTKYGLAVDLSRRKLVDSTTTLCVQGKATTINSIGLRTALSEANQYTVLLK